MLSVAYSMFTSNRLMNPYDYFTESNEISIFDYRINNRKLREKGMLILCINNCIDSMDGFCWIDDD